MNQLIAFKGVVEKFPGKSGWIYVGVPNKYTKELKDFRVSWGMYPITAYVGSISWKTKLMTKKGGSFFVALKASIRNTTGIKVGDTVNISFKLS